MPTAEREQKVTTMVRNRQDGLVLVMEDIADPHNIAAILRSADAFGVQDIHVVYETQPHTDLKRVGNVSSSSANKWVDVHYHDSMADCATVLRDAGYALVGTVLREGSTSIFDWTAPERTALVIGNEHSGMSQTAIVACDALVTIPMQGMIQSLNVSVSAAVCLFEITRQRRAANRLQSLSAQRQGALIDTYLS